jgi:DNA polymerase I
MTMKQEVVYLLDGSSYVHRAYHAIRNLSNSRGLPTNAVFGFSRMILKLLEEKNPSYLAVVLDAKGPTFRHEIYKDYKATRPPMPEDLQVQIPFIRKIVAAMNVKLIEKEGYEADDVIATLARLGQEHGHGVVVISGDKDFRQILSPTVSLWDTMKDSLLDYHAFVEKYGVKPEQMIDVMGLSGDLSDNIPGVKGIGEKTALNLVKQFGSLDEVLRRVDEVKTDRLKRILKEDRDKALLSKELVRIDRFVPVEESVEDLRVGVPDSRELAELFGELEFRDLRERFSRPAEADARNYRLVLSEADLPELLGQIREKGVMSLAFKTTAENPLRSEPVGLAFSFEEGQGVYIPLAHVYPGAPGQPAKEKVFALLKAVLEDENVVKVSRNNKRESLLLRRYGIEMKGPGFDTTVASYVINPGLRQHDLGAAVHHYLNHRMVTEKELMGRRRVRHFGELDLNEAMACACEETEMALRLRSALDEALAAERNRDLFYDVEMRLVPVLIDMEWTGIKVDSAFFQDLAGLYAEMMTAMEREIYDEAGMVFNINSSQQLGYVLFEKLGLPTQKKTGRTKAYSTDVKVLNRLATLPFKIPRLLLKYRTLSKLKSTYLDAFLNMVHPETGRIHTSFNQTVAATGRLSSSNPNLQNIPVRTEEGRQIRKGFVAEEGRRLLCADYSQIELRVFAHYSKDPAFVEAFKTGEDIHARTASEMLGVPLHEVTQDLRRIAKAVNFGIIYGMGPQKLSEELGIDLSVAKAYIAAYYRQYKGVVDFKEKTLQWARKNGYVSTLFGRRRYLPDINHKNRMIRGEAERMAVNTPIQGTAADLIKMAMIRIHDRLEWGSFEARMLLQVHDELVFEVPEEEGDRVALLVKEEMEGVHRLDVPLKVDVKNGYNWDEAH